MFKTAKGAENMKEKCYHLIRSMDWFGGELLHVALIAEFGRV
jgi:hypothetical protein